MEVTTDCYKSVGSFFMIAGHVIANLNIKFYE